MAGHDRQPLKSLDAGEAEHEAQLPYSRRARHIAAGLKDEASEVRREMRMATGSQRELLELRAGRLDRAVEMLRILDTEQFRQRSGAQHYLAGRVDRQGLREITNTWNSDPVASNDSASPERNTEDCDRPDPV